MPQAASSARPAIRPNPWLRELTTLKPAHWRWGVSIRAAIGMGLPLALGIVFDQLAASLWIAMGSLLQASAEREGPYKAIFWKIAISAPMGAAGCLLGYLSDYSWGVVTVTMVCAAFIGSIISSYSAALSSGSLQALVMGTVMTGNGHIGPDFWLPALMLLAGNAFYALMLGVEALCFRQRSQRAMLAALTQALRALALARADKQDTDAARRQVTDRLSVLYAQMLQIRAHAQGRNPLTERTAASLQRFDNLFACIMACQDADTLRRAAEQLQPIGQALAHGTRAPASTACPQDPALLRAVQALYDSFWNSAAPAQKPASGVTQAPAQARESRLRILLDRLTPGRATIASALALSLCVAIGFSLHWIDAKSHWYWVPMTILIIMKPDFGSIFARTILRSIGTSIGVILGAILLAVLEPGPSFVIVMTLIAITLPWASQRSYAMYTLALTPLVLVLIDFVTPETHGINYAALRLVDTLLGGLIVLVFGYAIWPKRHERQLVQAFREARKAIAAYLRACLPDPGQAQDNQQASACRRTAYGALADIRLQLQKSLTEPPPAGPEAAAWFPLITSAERICDAITGYCAVASEQPDPGQRAELERLAGLLATASHAEGSQIISDNAMANAPLDGSPESALISTIRSEMAHIHNFAEAAPDTAPKAAPVST